MKIAFYREYGAKKEIGMGHFYRSKTISEALKRKGHNISFIDDGILTNDVQVLIIDHISSQNSLILQAKSAGMKIVLIDGAEEDVSLADLSISAFFNKSSQYKGIKYVVVPYHYSTDRYRPYKKNKSILISMGGYDANNYAELILDVLDELGLNAIVTKSINHQDLKTKYPRIEIFDEEDYYVPMNECIIGIVNGGLTLFQGLYYGLPCLAIPQYEHQKWNIEGVSHCCVPTEPNKDDIKDKIKWLLDSEYLRESMSKLAQYWVDGKGTARVCDLVEGLK